MDRLNHPIYRHRILQMAADAALVAAAFYLAFRLRFLDSREGIPQRYTDLLTASIGFVIAGKLIIFAISGLYEKWWRYVTLPDYAVVLRAVAVSTGILVVGFTVAQPFHDDIPRSVVVMDFLLTLVFVGGARLLVRMVIERRARQGSEAAGHDVLVVGAGSGGQMVVRELQLNPKLGATAIGFVDDDPRKRGMGMLGLKVLGTTDQIGAILDETKPAEVVIAIPSAPGELRGRVVTACREREIPVRTLPTVFELLRGGVQLTRQLREVQVEDVLGREPILMEIDRVGAYMEDRKVLVTGAGGSIGSELCRQIARVRPRQLVLLDHAEDNLFQIEREMIEERHFTRVEAVLADVKEADRMLEVMQRYRPDVVFHAAAYKHVPLMESNPLEAIRNNALGTRVTAETAAASGVERFVLVSTDKAVNPRTVMGASKAIAEWIVESAGRKYPPTRFLTVRFGNVLASSGSVVPIFRGQIERGGPVTVTDAAMTRYFMTIPEAVQLVIRAGDLGAGTGEVFVLEMGEPVKIVELAHNMIKLAGYEPETDIAIEFTGRRPGEKLHEELFGADERSQPTAAEKIVRAVRRAPLDPEWVEGAVTRLEKLVRDGDESQLAEQTVQVVTDRRRNLAAGVTLDG
ncbi:MAG: polysaccharide biosynthesis protein [Solirubrobacterales bacterium]